jgi:diguanylate cyclase (GGDEF)-like protein/PAS domain S-box-containing protein
LIEYNYLFSIGCLVTATLTIALSLLSFWSSQFTLHARPLGFLLLFSSIYAFGYAFEIMKADPEWFFLWLRVEYFGISFIAGSFLWLSIEFTGRFKTHKPVILVVLAGVSLFFLIVVLTNNFHHLYYTSIEVDYRGLFPTAALGRGIFYILNALWFVGSFLLSFILCLHHFFRTTVVLRKRTLTMLIAVIVCLVNFLIYILKVIPWSLDIGPLVVTINGCILSIAIARLSFLNISPIAREQVFESMQDGVIVTDPQGRILDFNQAIQQLFPNLTRENIGHYLSALAPELEPYLTSENISKNNPLSIQKDGISRFYEVRKITINGKQNQKIGIALNIREITEYHKLLEKLQEYAEKDWLTGIWNRRKWMDLAMSEINRSKRYRRPLTIVYLDIDHFKSVNDNLGHEGGDMVLIHLVKNISSQLRANDIFGRIGGEEFVILFPELDKENAQNVTQRLLNTVSQEEILAYDQKLKVTISIGATVWEGEDSKVSLEELIQKADKALYMSKAAGRNQATFI